jgi:hypothetical protein
VAALSFELVMYTVTGSVGTAFRVIVPTIVKPDSAVAGEKSIDAIETGSAVTVPVAVLLARLAVIVAVELRETVPTFTGASTKDAPAGTETLAGTAAVDESEVVREMVESEETDPFSASRIEDEVPPIPSIDSTSTSDAWAVTNSEIVRLAPPNVAVMVTLPSVAVGDVAIWNET